MTTIQEYYKFKPIKPWTSSAVTPKENPCPQLLYGVELEIENCNEDWNSIGFTVTNDNSLRNGGLEFVSKPMTYSHMEYALTTFFKKTNPRTIINGAGFYTEDSNYSDRTSIHFHTNVGDMTFSQLATLLMLYETFERILYFYVGKERDKNIFCVPWYETTLSYSVVSSLEKGDDTKIRKWQKYTGLNLLPIQTQGSIEWRHLYGTSDLPFILTWMRFIGHMYSYALKCDAEKLKAELMKLNTSSKYDEILDDVFQKDANSLRLAGYHQRLENGIIDMKYTIMESKPTIKAPFDPLEIRATLNRLNPAQLTRPFPQDPPDGWRVITDDISNEFPEFDEMDEPVGPEQSL